MANRILRFMFFQSLFFLMFSCDLGAQKLEGLFYINEPIAQISSELKACEVSECNTGLLSISNLMSNYLFKVSSVPKSLLDFLIAKNIISIPIITNEQKKEVFLLGRYIHSVQYESYLLLFTEEYADIEAKNLYLINVKSDTLISVCNLASYLSVIGATTQSYSIYQGNDIFECFFEGIVSDVEFVLEEDKVRLKQEGILKVVFIVDRVSGKISMK